MARGGELPVGRIKLGKVQLSRTGFPFYVWFSARFGSEKVGNDSNNDSIEGIKPNVNK